MSALTLDQMNAARQVVLNVWLGLQGTPYFYGGKPGDARGIDCSGLIQAGWQAAGIWPFSGEASASMIWSACTRVEWDERLPGDVIAFGDGSQAHHVVGVVSALELIGANHGFSPQPGETDDAYRARIRQAGAQVLLCGKDYWFSKRLGVVRAPALCP